MELLLELLWCTIPAHAQSEKQYNFKEKVCKTTMQSQHFINMDLYALPVQDSLRPCFSLCRLTLPCRIFWKLPFSGPVLISPAVSRHDTLRTGHLRNNLIAIKLSLDWLWNCVSNGNGKQWNDNQIYFPSHGIYRICRSRLRDLYVNAVLILKHEPSLVCNFWSGRLSLA